MRRMFLLCGLALLLSSGIAYSAKAPNTGVLRPSVDTIYDVVINDEGAYSIWPADRENPLGWDDAGKTGTKEECLAWIKEQVEKQKRPGSSEIRIPTMAQNGRNLEIKLPTNANLKTASLSVNSKHQLAVKNRGHHASNMRTASRATIEPTEVTIDGQRAEVLEQSDNKIVVKIPSNLAGWVKIRVKHGDVEAEGTCRIVNVDVTATQTNLRKGQRAVVRVNVRGLEEIRNPVPLRVVSTGVIKADGGNVRHLWIRQADVQPGGRFTFVFEIVGTQDGVFNVTATVITQPWYVALVKDAKDNGWRAKKVGNGFVFIIENVKDPVTGGLLEGEYVLETGCLPGTQIKSLIPVLVKKGRAEVEPFHNCRFSDNWQLASNVRFDPPVNDPSKPSPTATSQLIQLTENAGENGFRLKKSGKSWRAGLENVKDPKKGDPLEGKWVVEYRCVPGTLIQTQVLVFKKGKADLHFPPICLGEDLKHSMWALKLGIRFEF